MVENLNKITGENIRERRSRLGLSIEELATALDLSAAFIGLVERGQRGMGKIKLKMACDILGCTIDEMMSDGEIPEKSYMSVIESQMKANKFYSWQGVDYLVTHMKSVRGYKGEAPNDTTEAVNA